MGYSCVLPVNPGGGAEVGVCYGRSIQCCAATSKETADKGREKRLEAFRSIPFLNDHLLLADMR
ncbi:UNVERIFIED_CONTAM: hypothetical protein Sangu_3259400 [Sesamum angustifolium]|uniref:Uncharacterized protein n=1 Tax=Sesamum angustifolium TaxID=2727405 RepID=A0AAW2JCH8_9LAMI